MTAVIYVLVVFAILKLFGLGTLAALIFAVLALAVWPLIAGFVMLMSALVWAAVLFIVGGIAMCLAKVAGLFK